jgi:hypothetical protein
MCKNFPSEWALAERIKGNQELGKIYVVTETYLNNIDKLLNKAVTCHVEKPYRVRPNSFCSVTTEQIVTKLVIDVYKSKQTIKALK